MPTVLVIIVLAVIWNRGYGPVSYPAYKMATALYGACLVKSEPRIDAIEVLLEEGGDGFEVEKISPQERKWLQAIIDAAQTDDWQTASANAKRLMEAQNNPVP